MIFDLVALFIAHEGHGGARRSFELVKMKDCGWEKEWCNRG